MHVPIYGGVLRITRNAWRSPAVARQAVPTVTVSNIPSSYTSRNPLLEYEIFYFSTCWIFKKVEIFGVRRVKRVEFRGDWSNRCWDMTIFRIFKMAIAGRFSKCGHFRGRGVKSVKVRQRSIFRGDRSRCWDIMAIFRLLGHRLVDWNSGVSVRPYVHKKFFPFWFNLVCG